MKPHNSNPLGTGAARGGRGRTPVRIPSIPMEWMDPMSWRLPSGKALAEFWLQSGFLAPLMLGSTVVKHKKTGAPPDVFSGKTPMVMGKKAEEAPGRSATFRETR
jgi:hypothetical protein